MKILLNDHILEISETTSLDILLNDLGQDDLRGWAVAINEDVIPRQDFENTFLSEGDRVLLIQATQGG
tara:strand:- start:238 stop:441 length:204 start_codon:yes stop_codon:yes gene_type:complete